MFLLDVDAEEGCARRTCAACKSAHFNCDSGEYWAEAAPRRNRCPCRRTHNEIAVGFAFRADGDVRWIMIGVHCVHCRVLTGPAEWKSVRSPTEYLLKLA